MCFGKQGERCGDMEKKDSDAEGRDVKIRIKSEYPIKLLVYEFDY